MELQCYNKGCGKKFDAAENSDGACQYHPGGPVFHDALKGWSCCRKRSTDFTEMLNIPGCTKGKHSDEKPKEQEKPDEESPSPKEETIIRGPPPVDTGLTPRPPEDTPMTTLKVTPTASAVQTLEKRLKELELSQADQIAEAGNQDIAVGTPCAHKGCEKRYAGEASLVDVCDYHPGGPVFHEGMKYWSCCQRKTSDFNSWLGQKGCETGKHQWHDKSCETKVEKCRVDWHQTPNNVCISVFAKVAVPDSCCVKTNGGVCSVDFVYDAGQCSFSRRFKLHAAIDVERSSVKILPMKVEANLKKADPISWKSLELEES